MEKANMRTLPAVSYRGAAIAQSDPVPESNPTGVRLLQKESSVRDPSFGVDFVDQGTYFQNSLSTDNFTFVSRFEGQCPSHVMMAYAQSLQPGCQNGIANNLLVDPNGDEYICSNTPLQPDDTPELSTCPIEKDNLFSGLWSLLIISNNGNGDPVAYERDITLSVGPQATTTFTPTGDTIQMTLPLTVTPLVNVTSTSTTTSTTVLPPSTVTSPSTTLHPTVTSTPPPVTVTKTVTLITLTITKPTLSVKKVTSTSTATCVTPAKQTSPDPTATITPTAITAAALQTPASGAKFRRVPVDREQRLKQRAERMVNKRAPDAPTITVTDTNTADYVTTTSTSTAPAKTVTVVTVVTTTATSTPPPVTVFSGVSSSAVVTVTATPVTKTKTDLVLFGFVTKTVTLTATYVFGS
ncbi:MAG: hypothetical protein Q9191_007365 [Dirinaria sp. TL-2023a]